jgi:penicillin-insensitive murein endopeptidase
MGDRLLAGQTVVVYSERPESLSESVGLPHGGSLSLGEQLPRHPGYVIRERSRAFGTRETCDAIVEAFDAVRAADADAPKLRIHDLSYREGGRISDHRSHQSGRDADITYYLRTGCNADGCPMRRAAPEDLDLQHTWELLRYWLEHDQVQAIFIDYSLQAPLYRYARSRGATRQQLHRWFQYPRGTGYPLGAIRHFPLHRDHMHVRFRCPDGDESCR